MFVSYNNVESDQQRVTSFTIGRHVAFKLPIITAPHRKPIDEFITNRLLHNFISKMSAFADK